MAKKKSRVTKRDLELFRRAMFAADGMAQAAGRRVVRRLRKTK